jgi:Leucine-rich repeat (LRR) protein
MKKIFQLFLALSVIFQLFLACKKNEDVVTPNSPPSSFVVSTKQTNTDLLVKWTKAKDPDGDVVTYTVVYKDTLARKISDTSYVIKSVPYASTITGNIIAQDSKGAKTIVVFSVMTNPNSPPSTFVITSKQTNTDLLLTWTKAKDPEGDLVNYTVVYKDTLARKITDTSYVLKNVPYASTITGSIIAKDSQGASAIVPFSIKTIEDPNTSYISILDKNFEKALIALKIDDIQDGKILKSSAEKVTSLQISQKVINSLKGIEGFKNLTYLDCSNNNLATGFNNNEGIVFGVLDLSGNPNLTYLDCSYTAIKILDVSKNTKLSELFCYANSLTSLDVSKNTNLTYLECEKNKLTSLNFNKNTELSELFCNDNSLTSLDISENINLTYLGCYNNSLTALDVGKNTNLTGFFCYSNQLKSLDLSKNIKLINFGCDSNQLKSLDTSKNINLARVSCNSNQLTSLDVSKNVNLIRLQCYSNNIQTICVKNLTQPTSDWKKDDTATYKVCP